MANFFDKVKNLINFDGDDEDYEQDMFEDIPVKNNPETEFKVKKGKVVNINTTTQLKVVVVSPDSFEEARDIAEHLKQKKPVVINLESVEKEVARRIIDFLSGAVYATEGNIQKISAGIFLVAPYNVGIMGDFKDELRNKGVFPWQY
ncbi:MAG: cell division protein SepF [Clostridia bacterium]|nr:cell division protein SepF [Clostridia bacterium]MBQ4543201.1 cell division protein SepF [Clostridia bacterium]